MTVSCARGYDRYQLRGFQSQGGRQHLRPDHQVSVFTLVGLSDGHRESSYAQAAASPDRTLI